MNSEQERLKLIRDFCIALDRKAKKFQSPKKIAYRLLQEIKKNRRGTRSINQYLDDHADLMREIVARFGMRTHNERNANGMLSNNQEPITNSQTPKTEGALACCDADPLPLPRRADAKRLDRDELIAAVGDSCVHSR